jgi:hypothetical protein
LGQALQPNPKFLDITLQKDLTLLDLSFFLVFFIQKKINPRHRAGHVTSNKLDLVLMFYCGAELCFYIKKYLSIEMGLKKQKQK